MGSRFRGSDEKGVQTTRINSTVMPADAGIHPACWRAQRPQMGSRFRGSDEKGVRESDGED